MILRDIKTLDDIKKIPLTDKEELRRYQEMEPFPYGGVLGRDIDEVTTFRQTSGTTGKPVYVPETYESWQWRIEVVVPYPLYGRVSDPATESFFPSVTMSMWPSGRPITPPKNSDVSSCPEEPSTQREGSTRLSKSGPTG